MIGSLCVIHTAPREFSEQDRNILRKVADDLMIRVENECARGQDALPVGEFPAFSELDAPLAQEEMLAPGRKPTDRTAPDRHREGARS